MITLKLIGRLAVVALVTALAFTATAAKRDFDGDGRADLFWYSDVTTPPQSVAIWLMDAGFPVDGTILTYNQILHIQTADLNGDGTHDIILDNNALWAELMQGTTILATGRVPHPPAGGVLQQSADFNADRRADIVFLSDAGETVIMLMDGLTVKSSTTLLMHDDWRVTFPVDFNGDGKSDLVWHNYVTGETAIWLMDGANYLSGAIVMANSSWTAGPAGDLDGDGKDDLVWRNSITGETALWLMDGTSMKAGIIVVADGNWTARHFGDLNGDGRSDIIWENGVTHATHVWLMNGLTMTVGGPVPLNGASVIVVDDFDSDGRDDLVTAEAEPTPGFMLYRAWLMDGRNVKSMAALLSSDCWRVVPLTGLPYGGL